jgi:hypothetical protein
MSSSCSAPQEVSEIPHLIDTLLLGRIKSNEQYYKDWIGKNYPDFKYKILEDLQEIFPTTELELSCIALIEYLNNYPKELVPKLKAIIYANYIVTEWQSLQRKNQPEN